MAKATSKPKAADPATTPAAAPPKPEGFLSWPANPKECAEKPRSFRVHRLNGFEWQAYVIEDGVELPMGKPDLFELIIGRVKGVLRAEGQMEFLAAKRRTVEAQAQETKADAKV